MALIDEFQDTDPVQWRIFRKLFGDGPAGSSLVLVGDPKQAIYGFRGGDIDTYIDAVGDRALARAPVDVAQLAVGHGRAHRPRHPLRGATFGDQSIRLRAGRRGAGAARTVVSRTETEPPLPALSLRLAVGDGIDPDQGQGRSRSPGGRATPSNRIWSPRSASSSITPLPEGTEDASTRPVRPHDIAVLVNTNEQCTAVQDGVEQARGFRPWWPMAGTCWTRRPPIRCGGCSTPWPAPPIRGGPAPTRCPGSVAGARSRWPLASDADLADIQEHLRDWSERLAHPPGGRRAGPGLVDQRGGGQGAGRRRTGIGT